MKIITFEKVPKAMLEVYKDLPGCNGVAPHGVTLIPDEERGFQKIEILIQEKMSQWDTRVAIAHELFHVLQYLTGCELDEENTHEIDDVMVKALKEKKKRKKED
jgi:hypothetical protein